MATSAVWNAEMPRLSKLCDFYYLLQQQSGVAVPVALPCHVAADLYEQSGNNQHLSEQASKHKAKPRKGARSEQLP